MSNAAPALPFEGLDLSRRELFRQGFPHEVFTRLRAEAPVAWHPCPEQPGQTGGEGFWVLSKHADIQAVSRDPETFSAFEGPQLRPNEQMQGRMLVSMEGVEHTRQRKLINSGFTPRMIGQLEEQARQWTKRILDDAFARGECNFVNDVAYKLPMHMIADILGIPVEDREWLFDKVNDWLMCTDPEHPTPESQQEAIQLEMFGYAHRLGAEKRSRPQDDVWTLLSTVEVDLEDGSRSGLSELELDLFFMLLIVAGSETTRNAISYGLLALLDNPDQKARLRDDPGAMPRAVDEILRWSSPVTYFRRRTVRDTEIRGVPIKAGENVTLWYPSGNRDADEFEDPFRFDIGRDARSQVAFGGGGVHYCLGANLAKREISILFEELLARAAEIEVLGDPTFSVQGLFNPIYVSLKSIPVRMKAR